MHQAPIGVEGKAVEEAAKLLPEVYKDAVQPAAKEIGTALGRAVRIALSPVRALAWSWERAESWLEEAVTTRLRDQEIDPGKIISPSPQLTAGVVRGVQAAGPETDPTLRDLFANLLATAMQIDRSSNTHPAFVEILSQLTPDEAKILRAVGRRSPGPLIVGVDVLTVEGVIPMNPETLSSTEVLPGEVALDHPELIESYFDNLSRLGLLRRDSEQFEKAAESNRATDKFDRERAERWAGFKSYLLSTCNPSVSEAIALYENRSGESVPTRPDWRRPAIRIRVGWTTSFGLQLLRASIDPAEFGSAAANAIAEESETESESADQGSL